MLGKILDQFGSRKNKKVWGLGGLSSKGPQIKIRSQKRIEKKNRAGGKSGRIGMSCEGESMRFCTSKKPSGATEAPPARNAKPKEKGPSQKGMHRVSGGRRLKSRPVQPKPHQRVTQNQ